MFLLGSSDEKAVGAAYAGSLALWSPGPGPEMAATVGSVTRPGAGHDNLEDLYAGMDSLVDTTAGHAESNTVEEEDPLAEFEAWIASGAVQIVDKL